MQSFLPNEGCVRLTAKQTCRAGFRIYDWMGTQWTLVKNGEDVPVSRDAAVTETALQAGDVLELRFAIETKAVHETVRGTDFTVYWRGCDVVDLSPRGEHVRLYQRDLSVPKYYPTPDDVIYTGAANMGPTQQKQ